GVSGGVGQPRPAHDLAGVVDGQGGAVERADGAESAQVLHGAAVVEKSVDVLVAGGISEAGDLPGVVDRPRGAQVAAEGAQVGGRTSGEEDGVIELVAGEVGV